MLIDTTHAEETRVVVVKGNRLAEFDFESATKKQLKGNIYLAKVTRVEPSLQAVFVDYGGNRHGFLAFNEIHPDYYQVPVADREALLQQEAEQAAQDAALEDAEAEGAVASEKAEPEGEADDSDGDGENGNGNGEAGAEAANGGGEDALDEVPRPRSRSRRSYKIQEVIKKRQILLVQVVKEERGNKGAALTTYLSLAGRYCVLMPNTARGGGISRKISNPVARRKLKTIVADLDVPEGMGVIVRTAGQNRTKSEIKRDFEYLLRLWDSVRDRTLQSTAPTIVHEEADLIKRAIRDVYTKDVDEILVEGDDGYRAAKDFMRMLLPSHAKKVQPYRDRIPLLHRYQVEQQLDSIHSNVVHLKSGGYLVINSTEALVAVDVNSGRATKERNIEETALKTNLEASEEVARQLRLRDLAGLIVIDYIDMEENRHNRAVERRLKDCLKDDRARIQVGRISGFGLLEMSRQRLRPSLFEASTVPCPHCDGTGYVRSTESTTLHVLRAIEEEGIRRRAGEITVHVPTDVALYMLNQKRRTVAEIEQRYGFDVQVFGDNELIAPNYRLDITRPAGEDAEDSELPEQPVQPAADEAAESGRRGKRRRRGRKRSDEAEVVAEAEAEAAPAGNGDASAEAGDGDSDGDGEDKPKRRRRGRRGGRRRRSAGGENGNGETAPDATAAETPDDVTPAEETADSAVAAAPIELDTTPVEDAPDAPADAAVSAEEADDSTAAPDAASVPADSVAEPMPTAVAAEPVEETATAVAEAAEAPEAAVATASDDTAAAVTIGSGDSAAPEAPLPSEDDAGTTAGGMEEPAAADESWQPQAAGSLASVAASTPVTSPDNGGPDNGGEDGEAAAPAADEAETLVTEPQIVAEEAKSADDAKDAPKRRGWWQRRTPF